jgi:hypothetical protein
LLLNNEIAFLFIAVSASGIMHALNNMKHQEQNGNFHPPRHLQQSHNQIQVRVIGLQKLCIIMK